MHNRREIVPGSRTYLSPTRVSAALYTRKISPGHSLQTQVNTWLLQHQVKQLYWKLLELLPVPKLAPWKTREAHHTTSSPPESFYLTLLDCSGRKCMNFVTKYLFLQKGQKRDQPRGKGWHKWKSLMFGVFWFFGIFFFMGKENLFYAEEV